MIRSGVAHVYRFPAEEPESDGTLQWDHTDLVLVRVEAMGLQGIGYTYANTATARMVQDQLLPLLFHEDPMDIARLWEKMRTYTRNSGHPGITAMAISAVDMALWDLKARLLNLPLCKLLGQVHSAIPAYASGGFTSYGPEEIRRRFEEWTAQHLTMFKMKIGRNKNQDLERMKTARETIGDAALFVDANGAYFPREAVAMAAAFSDLDICWYEEPVTSDHLEGLRFVRNHTPPKVCIATGEYGYDLSYFQRMLAAECIDILQADVTRCGGITGLLSIHALCEAHHVPLSTHCSPAAHLHPALALSRVIHVEYFRDHVALEQQLFDGAAAAASGVLSPDLSRPGMGLEFKDADGAHYQIL